MTSRGASTGPPPAGGHNTSIQASPLLRQTRETALKTPGITWLDDDEPSPPGGIVSGRETRKMNTFQAIRDAMGLVR